MDFKGERIREVSLRSCSCNCEELTSLHQEGEGGRERGREAAGRQGDGSSRWKKEEEERKKAKGTPPFPFAQSGKPPTGEKKSCGGWIIFLGAVAKLQI